MDILYIHTQVIMLTAIGSSFVSFSHSCRVTVNICELFSLTFFYFVAMGCKLRIPSQPSLARIAPKIKWNMRWKQNQEKYIAMHGRRWSNSSNNSKLFVVNNEVYICYLVYMFVCINMCMLRELMFVLTFFSGSCI